MYYICVAINVITNLGKFLNHIINKKSLSYNIQHIVSHWFSNANPFKYITFFFGEYTETETGTEKPNFLGIYRNRNRNTDFF